ncbi:thiol reductant ABC exporter subunit CydD [Microbacterium sp. C7(2022)]|uniref:thiol reductant ABC exporter subunit CydD n=1 Tax=Microbacterium sp. C7(2022) TaxID=2992759 RepID=UPI00237BA47A|nr:thiol reductant ABC exporter subunit CydD [Microbacterium sp. C7(2022)]MDE0546061.1 thiol reductant ABC exporter subunit CydD [Microbacterium sp. C7(2022)]
MNEQTDAAAPPRTRTAPVDPRLLRYARASRGFFVLIALIALAQTATIVAFAWLLTAVITGALDGTSVAEQARLLAFLGLVAVARALLLWAREAIAARAAARVQTQLRTALVDAVSSLGAGWLAGRNSAHLSVTGGRGLDALEAYFGRYLPQLVQTVIATPILVAVMWWFDWISGLTVLLTLPLIPVFMILIGLATQSVQRTQWQTLQRLAARFSDTVEGLSTLKVFGRQHRAVASIESVTDEYRRQTMRVLRVSFLSGFALEFFASISVAIVAVSIGFRLIDGSLLLGVGLFVLLLAPEAYLPLRQVGVQFHAASEGAAATNDVFDVLDAAREHPRGDGAATTIAPPALDADVTVSLSHVRARRGDRLLAPVTLTATPGSVTVIEGPSGAGKTSVLAALLGTVEFEGEITLRAPDRTLDAASVPAASWLAWAGQRPGLVSGTVAENVALGDNAADADLVTRALDLACITEVSPTMSLGVQGSGLSGGQAQRVAIARAFYRHLRGRGPVIALDEPSAALDAATESRLWRNVRALADAGATVLVVSHRTSVRAIADQVVTLSPPAPAPAGGVA